MSRLRSSVRRQFRFVHAPALGGLAACVSLACGGAVEQEQGLQRSQSDLTLAVAPTTGQSCDDLLARFKSVLLAQVGPRAEAARTDPYYYPLLGDVSATPRGLTPPGVPAPEPGAARPRFSETTRSVPGGDPTDLVKAEGDRIYLLNGTSLLVLDATDASSLQLVASVALGEDSSPSGIVVHRGRVAVFSTVYGSPLPTAQPLDPYGYSPYFTKVVVVDTTVATPAIVSESYFEGDSYYQDRSGSVVRAFVQQTAVSVDSPPVSYTDIFGNRRSQEDIDSQVDLWVEYTTESIEASTIESYLPERFDRVGGVLQQAPLRCADLLSLPLDSQGVLVNSSLLTLDLAAPTTRPALVSLSGYVQGVTFSENTAVVVQQDYGNLESLQPTVLGNLHLFQLDGAEANYVGSGVVAGYFTGASVDEARGVLNVVSQRDVYEPAPDGVTVPLVVRTVSSVQTLRIDVGALEPLGESPELPGDYLNSVRFADDRLYASTYRSNGTGYGGNFFVVDLSDPVAPSVSTSLELDGLGSVLVPVGSEHVVSVAQSADPLTGAGSLSLQLLDVGDPAAPALADELALGSNVYSEATYEPRALSIHADGNVFALPVDSYEPNASSLEVYQLTDGSELQRLGGVVHELGELTLLQCLVYIGYPTDAESLAALVGSPELAAALLRDCSYYRLVTQRRGLFRGDELFAVSSARVSGHALDALSGPPLSAVELAVTGLSAPVPVPAVDPLPAAEPEAAPASEE